MRPNVRACLKSRVARVAGVLGLGQCVEAGQSPQRAWPAEDNATQALKPPRTAPLFKHALRWFRLVLGLSIWTGGWFTPPPILIAAPPPQSSPGIPASSSAPPLSSASSTLPRPFTTINSEALDFDYGKQRIATFEGNVVAVDPKLTLKCKTMKVFFSEKGNEVIRIEAYHEVRMVHESKEAVGDKAVFTKETEAIVLSGGTCKLRDEKGNWIRSRGDGISYNIRTRQMHVDKPEVEFQSSSGDDLLKPSNPP